MQTLQSFKTSLEIGNPIHPAAEVGTVTLKVADLPRSLTFYTELIGLRIFQQTGATATLGAGSRPILNLEEIPGARNQPVNTTGLYHAAILLPDRHSLAIKISQLQAIHYPLGFADHLVSEAFYLSDPDSNGLELYRDRPRSEWQWHNQSVQMATDPIDFFSFFGEVQKNDPALTNFALPAGTRLGHMHLRVADIAEAENFYHKVLGFDITARLPSALFVSAGGYHHHIGMNTWESRGGKPPLEPSAGLGEFSVSLPAQAELDHLVKQILASGVAVERSANSASILDPFQNRIRLVLANQLNPTG